MFNNLFFNIGNKFKTWAKIHFWFLTISSLGTCLVMLMINIYLFLFIGLPCLVAGPIIAWLSALQIYAVGEIIDTLYGITASIRKTTNTSDAVKSQGQLLALESNLKLGMITEKEYQTKRAEIINNL